MRKGNVKTMKPIPEHGDCFVCGTENPHSIGVTWYAREDGAIVASHVFTLAQQGPPGYAHGGASAAVLDEAMGFTVWRAGFSVVAVNLTVDYRRPVPLGETVSIEARLADRQGRAIHAQGEIRLADGTVAVEGHGTYVEAPQFFRQLHRDEWKMQA